RCSICSTTSDDPPDHHSFPTRRSSDLRSPKIGQPGPGREHWADAGCVLFYGGGMKMGQVIGATDSRAERARTGNISFQNIFSTIDRKSTRLNSSHSQISYAVFCLKKKI